jgi:hypothetical protein
MKQKSNKSLKELYADDLVSDPYREVSLADMAESEDPEAMQKAVVEQKKQRSYFDRLKSKLERN